jgi:hypothetical protein
MKYLLKPLLAGALLLSMSYARAEEFVGSAELAAPVAQPVEKVVKNVTWRCEGTSCVAAGGQWSGVQSFVRRCRLVSEAVGPLKSFTISSEGRGLSASPREIETCNKLAHGKK